VRSFASTRGALDLESLPMRLYQKSKRLGTWDPRDLDFSRDVDAWQELTPEERDLLLRVTALFQAGEEAVTVDLLPLLEVIGAEGRLEEGLFLTAWLWEEGKHTEFFRRFLDEVVGDTGDLHHLHGEAYRRVFGEELPAAMNALRTDPSPAAQARAVVTYTMIVEGVLAETGYHGYFTALERRGVLTGLKDGLALVKRDESRHIAYGVYLLSRLVQEDPGLWPAIETRMEELLPVALGVVHETFAAYEEMPFGLDLDEFVDYAIGQYGKRIARIERAQAGGPLDLGDEDGED
jgi:ribonucleoside-diphosphate reductase beta chain